MSTWFWRELLAPAAMRVLAGNLNLKLETLMGEFKARGMNWAGSAVIACPLIDKNNGFIYFIVFGAPTAQHAARNAGPDALQRQRNQ